MARKYWLFLSSITAISLIGITLWCIITHPDTSFYGEEFIIDEWHLIPFLQFKPITLIIFLGFLSWAFFLEGIEGFFRTVGEEWQRFLMVIAALTSFGALYELFFNFTLWGALMVYTDVVNPDTLVNRFPVAETTVSLVYASKLVLLTFAISSYTLLFFLRVYLKKEKQ